MVAVHVLYLLLTGGMYDVVVFCHQVLDSCAVQYKGKVYSTRTTSTVLDLVVLY